MFIVVMVFAPDWQGLPKHSAAVTQVLPARSLACRAPSRA